MLASAWRVHQCGLPALPRLAQRGVLIALVALALSSAGAEEPEFGQEVRDNTPVPLWGWGLTNGFQVLSRMPEGAPIGRFGRKLLHVNGNGWFR